MEPIVEPTPKSYALILFRHITDRVRWHGKKSCRQKTSRLLIDARDQPRRDAVHPVVKATFLSQTRGGGGGGGGAAMAEIGASRGDAGIRDIALR